MNGQIEWEWWDFGAMPPATLYSVLAARQNVFIIEQACIYPDIDGYDQGARHLVGWHWHEGARTVAAYLRLLAPGVKYAEMSVGRVLSTASARGGGAGRQLLAEGLRQAELEHPGTAVRISAQMYLLRFYESYGFRPVGEPYDEDGIPHVEMLRPAPR